MASPSDLTEIARRIRVSALDMIYRAQSGHPGGSFSETEILVALYFGGVLRVDPKNPSWPDRDRFIVSKGHASPGVYAALAEKGFFPKDETKGFRAIDSLLQGHVDTKVPGVEFSAGSLGQGLSFGVGCALAARMDGKSWRTFVLLGDGELQEGQCWEAAMTAAHFKLDNLTAIVDRNGIQNDWFVKETKDLGNVAAKFASFGWHAVECEGHDVGALVATLQAVDRVKGKPRVVVANTVKGKGVSYMENNPDYHGKSPNEADYRKALVELGAAGGGR
ncbi:MAG TPA: transketolase [Candidatus Thermoplasmatota archaeon]|nr:transketolase [Candidatus Thermoplasmatota archaeon]